VDWPREDALRQQLAAARRPRVLLVEPDQPPPLSGDGLEDWVRLPVDPEELRIRIATVASRAGAERWHAAGYVLDDQGVLRAGTEWAAFPPIEARLLARLLDRAGHVVHRDELARVVWPDGPPVDPRALDGVVKRIWRRAAPLGIRLHTVTGRGFLLEW
jgi:two-component system, OmpR family, response regulator